MLSDRFPLCQQKTLTRVLLKIRNMTVEDMKILVRITSWNSKAYIACLPANPTCGVIMKAIAPRITFLLAFALLAMAIAPVMAIIVEEA